MLSFLSATLTGTTIRTTTSSACHLIAMHHKPLVLLPTPGNDEELGEFIDTISRALDGVGPAVMPIPADDPARARELTQLARRHPVVPNSCALVVATSGSMGSVKAACLSAAALLHSARASCERVGSLEGGWLLQLPLAHIAGILVVVRALVCGTRDSVRLPTAFSADGFVTDFACLRSRIGPSKPIFTSLVPAQLHTLLGDQSAVAALAQCEAVLVGGAALAPSLREQALQQGVRVVCTYGSSETAGGCVYDGVPLRGVDISTELGRICVSGPTLASGYLGREQDPAFADHTFLTDDSGRFQDGVLSVSGRCDDAISTAGVLIWPQRVEAALLECGEIAECYVSSIPDARLGNIVVALVCLTSPGDVVAGSQLESEMCSGWVEHVATQVGKYAPPRVFIAVDSVPRLGHGKVDRRIANQIIDDSTRTLP